MDLSHPDELSKPAVEYSRKRGQFQSFADEMRRILIESLKRENVRCQSIEGRAKTVESFDRKCKKTTDTGQFKYDNPLGQITDLAGVRVIVYTLKDLNRVTAFLEKHFVVGERKDVGDERFDQGSFGYQSIHYLLRFRDDRLALPEFSEFQNLVCEVQVRTVLQHAWAEIEHDVQYKRASELPKAFKKKFLSLAGLLEIADREFQSIQDEDEKLKSSILTELQEDLTRDAISKVTHGGDANREPLATAEPQGVRALLLERRYEDAINAYSKKIDDHPQGYTLYLGRAKAKFLAGNISGAEEDLNAAEKLNPGATEVARLRDQIVEGNARVNPPINSESANTLTSQGHDALRKGKGEEAYEFYSRAQEAGASRPFSILNKAMSCVVAGDYEGAKIHLDGLRIHPGTPMEINIRSVEAIASALRAYPDTSDRVSELQRLVQIKGDYSLELSPLPILKEGLMVAVTDERDRNAIASIFGCLGEQNANG
jgi:ppGpp synthetase/RelA/SpoT-type nucleotidyltranferase